MAPSKTKCLVTGGNGFLGQHLVAQLANSGEYEVTVFDIRPPVIPFPGVKYITGDLTKEADVDAACKGGHGGVVPGMASEACTSWVHS